MEFGHKVLQYLAHLGCIVGHVSGLWGSDLGCGGLCSTSKRVVSGSGSSDKFFRVEGCLREDRVKKGVNGESCGDDGGIGVLTVVLLPDEGGGFSVLILL